MGQQKFVDVEYLLVVVVCQVEVVIFTVQLSFQRNTIIRRGIVYVKNTPDFVPLSETPSSSCKYWNESN